MKKSPMTAIMLMASIQLFSQQTDSAEVYFQKGIEQRAAKKYLMAANYLDKAVKFNTKYKEAYLENGYVNLEMRKTDNAITNFSKVLEIEPSNAQALNELMQLYYNYRQFPKAKEIASKCNSCLNAGKIIAMCNFQEEDYGNAVKGLMSYLSKNPQDPEATYTLGRSYLEMEQFKEAIPYYTKAVVLNAEKNMWAYELGMIYYTIEDFKNAVVYFNKAAEKGYPQKSDFTENLAYAYLYSGQTDQGEKMLTELINKRPGDKDLLRDMAEVFYKKNVFDKSLSYCEKLMQMDAKDGKALYQAGLCFQKMGQKDKGQAMCDQAIELDPSLASKRTKQSLSGL